MVDPSWLELSKTNSYDRVSNLSLREELRPVSNVWERFFRAQRTPRFRGWDGQKREQETPYKTTLLSIKNARSIALLLLHDIYRNEKNLVKDEAKLMKVLDQRLQYISDTARRVLKKNSQLESRPGDLIERVFRNTSPNVPFRQRVSNALENIRRINGWNNHFKKTKLPKGFSLKTCFLDKQFHITHHIEANHWLILYRGKVPMATFGVIFHKEKNGTSMIITNAQGSSPVEVETLAREGLAEFRKQTGSNFRKFLGNLAMDYAKKHRIIKVYGGRPTPEGTRMVLSTPRLRMYRQTYRDIGLQETQIKKGVYRSELTIRQRRH